MTQRTFVSHIRNIAGLGIPLLAGNFSHYLLQIADTAMVGRLGTAELASIALAGLFTGVLYCLVWPVSLGCQAIAARRFGRMEMETDVSDSSQQPPGDVMDNAVFLGVGMGFGAVLLSFTARPLLRLLVKDDSLVAGALSYIRTIRWQLPFMGLVSAFTGFLAAVKRTKPVMIGTLAGNILNIGFNYVFIYGAFGLPSMGIRGAALGTVLAEGLSAVFFLAVTGRRETRTIYSCLRFKALGLPLMRDIIKVATPPMIQNSIAIGIFLAYESIVGRLGTAYLAVTHIVFSMFRINKTIVGGFARGSAILVGNLLGKRDREQAVCCAISCEILAAIIGFIIFAAALLFPRSITGIFTADPETVDLGVKAMRFFAPFFLVEILGYSFEIIFTSNGFGKLVLASEFSTNVLFILALSWLLTSLFHFGIYGAWLGFGLYQIVHAFILFAGFLSKRWLKTDVESGAGT